MKLVSTLTPNFWPGLKVLAHSLKHRGGITGLDWIILTQDGQVPDEWYEWLNRCGFNLVSKPFSDVGSELWPKRFPRTLERFVFNWNRLRAFLLPPGEYVLMDADLLCMNPCEELLSMPSISAAIEPSDKPPLVSTGLLRMDSSRDLFMECLDVMDGVDECLAEQYIINAVLGRHPGLLNVLDYKWEMVWSVAIRNPNLWRPDDAKFIHYTWDVKPWMGRTSTAKPQHQGIWNKAADIWRDCAKEVS
jgi:hypothetical protein